MNPTLTPTQPFITPKSKKNDTKFKEYSKVRIERNIENENYYTLWVDPEQFEPEPNNQKGLFLPKKAKKIALWIDEIKSNIENEGCSAT